MKNLALLFVLFWFPLQGQDYFWGTNLEGKKTQFESFDTDPFKKVKKDWQAELSKIEPRLRVIKDQLKTANDSIQKNLLKDNYFKIRNRFAYILISLGRTDEALTMLKELEKENPGNSSCAENLAYCYGEMNDFKTALLWTRTALERSNISKSSSLNIYEKILEAKIRLKENPGSLKNIKVMDIHEKVRNLDPLDFNDMENYRLYWKLRNKARLMRERILIEIQRSEENDPVIACLIAELGMIYSMTKVCEMAVPFFEKALVHDHPNPENIKLKIAKLEKLIAGNSYSMVNTEGIILQEISTTTWVISALGTALLLLLFYLWWKEKKIRKRAEN